MFVRILVGLLFCHVSPSTAHAGSPSDVRPLVYELRYKNQTVHIPFEKKGEALFNDVCLKNESNCKALKIYNGKSVTTVAIPGKKEDRYAANPASTYCENTGGTPVSLISPQKDNQSFCTYQDHSIIRSWDLFRRHFPEDSRGQR